MHRRIIHLRDYGCLSAAAELAAIPGTMPMTHNIQGQISAMADITYGRLTRYAAVGQRNSWPDHTLWSTRRIAALGSVDSLTVLATSPEEIGLVGDICRSLQSGS